MPAGAAPAERGVVDRLGDRREARRAPDVRQDQALGAELENLEKQRGVMVVGVRTRGAMPRPSAARIMCASVCQSGEECWRSMTT